MNALRREDLLQALPYARRYARALTGSQMRGDALVAETLSHLLSGEAVPPDEVGPARHILFWGVTRMFDASSGVVGDGDAAAMPSRHRQILLLTALEDVDVDRCAPILGMSLAQAQTILAEARERLRATAAADVLIIEDEPIIAMDLEELVRGCGHRVVGVAGTEAEAVDIARRTRPGLILADINLGVGGDGTHAVATILRAHYAPVIFVTAYPERLLTGDAVEPAFVMTKPFEPLTLAIATYQAVSGGVQLDKV